MINGVELKEESAAKCQILYEQEELAMIQYSSVPPSKQHVTGAIRLANIHSTVHTLMLFITLVMY